MLKLSLEGVITTASRFYTSPNINFTFKKNVLLISKHDLNLEQVEKPGVKHVKIRDVLPVTPFFVKPKNAKWLKQVLNFQASLENQAGPSMRPVAADSENKRVLKNKPLSDPAPIDKRGRHISSNKTPETIVNEVKDFINTFPKYYSHYTRHKSETREYLPPHFLSIRYSVNVSKVKGPV